MSGGGAVAKALHAALACLLGLGALALGVAATAQEMTFFRIGTGGVAGTYYPIGGLIADIISSPPGARPCERGGSCGVPGLVGIVQSSNGAVANVEAIGSGEVESGFVQSDVAYWAYTGTGIYEGKPKVDNLRAIANLYPESIHLVARKGAGIRSVQDLAGKRVSLDEPGSGTLVDARVILDAFGLAEDDLQAKYIKPSEAVSQMSADELDAFIFVAGYPTASVEELCASAGCELVPIDGPQVDELLKNYRFFAKDVIPAGTYDDIPDTPTVSVGAQWVVGAEVDEELVYGITKALWHENARKLLDEGHPKGSSIRLETALDGIAIPLHPGAARYYREVGMLK
ncbi:MAG TPA: TAXI family TRAP transporter solute-binding subunit [Geminicoccaceae bacterium]|nr:TAXI family TRAP transporter solute-binding subunit [Geminicoccaceae bacterium]